MNTAAFGQLVELLPRGDEFRSKRLPTGLSYVESPNPCFVEPDLIVDQAIEPDRTSVVLLSAPGAVGKTTLAAELASRTGATLWDLSKVQVGSRTFAGTIMEAYDFEATGVLKRLNQGNFLLILDALDEAQVRAGSQNFDAFLGDIARTFEAPRARPTLVLLARSDTADWIHLLLNESRVPLARYQIAFFDEAQAVSFLEKRLDDKHARDGGQRVHRQQAKPYAQVRAALFEQIYKLFSVSADLAWDDARVRDFLGYAPVLAVLADYLDVSNYMTLLRELTEGRSSISDPWQFLTEIINRLLQREQSKVRDAVQANLETEAARAGWSEWNRLYTPDEQCTRVLSRAISSPSEVATPGSMPRDLINQYENALKTIVPQHPFLSGQRFANVVFKEFGYAWGVSKGSEVLARGIRDVMGNREKPFLPSQLFSRFVMNLAGKDRAVLDGQDFGVFYESLLSRTTSVFLNLTQSEEYVQGLITLGTDEVTEVEVEILDTGAGVHFWRRLANADVDVKIGVRLGLPLQRFALGPGVDLRCEQLCLDCESIDADLAENVTIRARSFTTEYHPIRLKTTNETRGRLAVLWPAVGHPWAPYRAAEAMAPLELSETPRGDTLRKFILMFRRQRSRKESTLRGARWAPEQLSHRNELIELALKRGVIRSVGVHSAYAFNSDFDSLKALVGDPVTLSPLAGNFVTEYLGKDQADRILRLLQQ
jgi:hypothetical protein